MGVVKKGQSLLVERSQKEKVMDWKAMKEWRKPPAMIVNGVYPLLSKCKVSERSMIMLLIIEYLIGMLPSDVTAVMDGHWPSPGDLQDMILMACMVAYKLSPDTRQILDILGDLFEEAMTSLKARGEVLGADDPGPGAEIRRPQEVKAELGRLHEVQQREARAIDEYVRYGPHTTGPPRQQPPRDASSDEDGFQEAHDEQPPVPHGRQPIPASRDMFTESERRSMSRTPAEMFQCPECGGCFVTPERLRAHELLHVRVMPPQPRFAPFKPKPNPARPNQPVIVPRVVQHERQISQSPEIAQMQCEISELKTMVGELCHSLARTSVGDNRPLAQRRPKRSTAGVGLCKGCNFPARYCECDISDGEREDFDSRSRLGNDTRARNALSSIAGLPMSMVFTKRRVLLKPDVWMDYFISGAEPRDLRVALMERYVTETKYEGHDTIKRNNKKDIETIMLLVATAMAPVEFNLPPLELDTQTVQFAMRSLQENMKRAEGGEKAAMQYKKTIENDSAPEDERRAMAAGDKACAKAEEIRAAARPPRPTGKDENGKRYKPCPDAQWAKMTPAEKKKWRKENPV